VSGEQEAAALAELEVEPRQRPALSVALADVVQFEGVGHVRGRGGQRGAGALPVRFRTPAQPLSTVISDRRRPRRADTAGGRKALASAVGVSWIARRTSALAKRCQELVGVGHEEVRRRLTALDLEEEPIEDEEDEDGVLIDHGVPAPGPGLDAGWRSCRA
jgi:hypothetical protein